MKAMIFLVMLAGGGSAAELNSSLRPVARIVPVAVVAQSQPEPALLLATADISVQAASLSLRPALRPRSIEQKAMAKRREQRRGAVCGDVDIQGEAVGFVPGRINGCGIKDAVKIRAVSGISLSQEAVVDCGTAKALKSWVNKSAKPALRNTGGGLKQLKVAAHYACRTRNNQAGGKISEHGRGRAIDISGFHLNDGSLVTVLKGWNAPSTSKAMRKMHKDACGPFGTVLGPNSDRFHKDHFHFDTARYRSGPYCR
ncbi:MAG: extensin family protein [Aliishimia sp.]